MSVVLVNFADEKMTRSQLLCNESAAKCGVDMVYSYNNYNISKEFYASNADVLNSDRGAGYWLWKPYFINRKILDLADGDILIYCDSGIEWLRNANEIISRMDEDIFFFTNGHIHAEWCKMDVMKAINSWPFDNDKQVQASVIFFKVNNNTRRFVEEWLLWCQMPGFIDDSPSVTPNYPTFAEHRHDQAVLTCLQIKYGYKLHWWPTQYSEHIRIPGDDYPAMFNHHRKRNNEW
jgi:hypothetical protein